MHEENKTYEKLAISTFRDFQFWLVVGFEGLTNGAERRVVATGELWQSSVA